ncbi:hypothetical protein DFH08DRAFT_805094 [Mycena albidolilacea]|uniref:Uncharacterized protein n=1 Tax=Mycena albidolilacea TaxID=1033008 RepID=A0AAD7EWG0_9AGAR|nr:hypothetical protein DFH08DRAFT_805094 [Mycena albidolilacea]
MASTAQNKLIHARIEQWCRHNYNQGRTPRRGAIKHCREIHININEKGASVTQAITTQLKSPLESYRVSIEVLGSRAASEAVLEPLTRKGLRRTDKARSMGDPPVQLEAQKNLNPDSKTLRICGVDEEPEHDDEEVPNENANAGSFRDQCTCRWPLDFESEASGLSFIRDFLIKWVANSILTLRRHQGINREGTKSQNAPDDFLLSDLTIIWAKNVPATQEEESGTQTRPTLGSKHKAQLEATPRSGWLCTTSLICPELEVTSSLAAAAGHRWLLAAAAERCLAASITEARQSSPVTGGPSYRPLAGFHWFPPEGAGRQQATEVRIEADIPDENHRKPARSDGIQWGFAIGFRWNPASAGGFHWRASAWQWMPPSANADQPVATSAHIITMLRL